ncbi:MAG: hypothetical protein M0Z55_07835 [Peptococcaceae bacterium]|nr:hypothetical protein [Peptococcaceae bacterium]
MGRRLKRKTVSLLLVVMFVLTTIFPLGVLADTAAAQPFTVTLLGTSDLHGQLMGWNYFTKSAATGLTRVATLIAQERATHPNNILVDAGDTIQGYAFGVLLQQSEHRLDDRLCAELSHDRCF